MKRKKVIILIGVFLVFGICAVIAFNFLGKQKLASLEVDSNVNLKVYVDGKEAGMTPYTSTYEPRQVVVKIGDYQTAVELQPGIKTIIQRDFDQNQNSTGGEVASFEKTGENNAVLAVISNPDGALIYVDNVLKGISPLSISDLNEGNHNLRIEAKNYINREFAVNLVSGYKLIAIVDLSPQPASQTQTQVVSNQSLNEVVVQILSTPTGFLRVRQDPTTASPEVGQVKPGEKYPFIEVDKKTGWYKIELGASLSGWISNTYAATASSSIGN